MFAALYIPSSDGPIRAALGPFSPLSSAARPECGPPSEQLQLATPHPSRDRNVRTALMRLARSFSPRVELHGERLVLLDVNGLKPVFGEPTTLGESVCRAASEQEWSMRVAIAATRTAALLMAIGRSGLTVVPPGSEAAMLAPLPLSVLRTLAQEQATGMSMAGPRPSCSAAAAGAEPGTWNRESGTSSLALPAFTLLSTVQRWGLKTLGEVAALPSADLFERLGAGGLELLRLARGEDERPLVPDPVEERFETALALEWPIETLEPLAFVLSRVLDPLCTRLEQRAMAAAALHVQLTLVTRESYVRMVQLPMPLRDPRVLRTLVLLDLESHPPLAGIDRISVAIDPVPARTVQFSLLERARPTAAALSTLIARLESLMGEGRCGRPEPIDAHRPDAFEMRPFNPDVRDQALGVREKRASREQRLTLPPTADRLSPGLVPLLRRFRHPVPACVRLEHGRPVRVATGFQTSGGGRVVARAGPWRGSGEWWNPGDRDPAVGGREEHGAGSQDTSSRAPREVRSLPAAGAEPRVENVLGYSALAPGAYRPSPNSWDREEWDVTLSDGGVYRIFRDRQRDRWFVEGMVD